MSRTCAWISLICLSITTSWLPGCGEDPWVTARAEMTFNMQDGSTHRLNGKGWFAQGNISDNWFILILPDKAGYSFDIHFDPELISGPGNYDLVQSGAISGSVDYPDSTGDTNYASHHSGVVRIDSVGFNLGDTLSGSFEEIIMDPWDQDDPNPCLSISDGIFSATNEGPDM